MNPTNYLRQALIKLTRPTAKTVHLSAREAIAVLDYIAAHGLDVDPLIERWQEEEEEAK
jgi:hypothetical protein